MTRTLLIVLSLFLLLIERANARSLEWLLQFGTSGYDSVRGVSADSLGNVFVSGEMLGTPSPDGANVDMYLRKFDALGVLAWTQPIDVTSDDTNWDLAADGLGNVYVAGSVDGNASGRDAFLTKYDANGVSLWSRQRTSPGAQNDSAFGVAADSLGNVFVSGLTSGKLGEYDAGGAVADAYVSKYSASGDLLWTRQLHTDNYEEARGIATDGLGNVVIAGSTSGSLAGSANGSADAFVSKYDTNGNLSWIRQFGTAGSVAAGAVAIDWQGNVLVTGVTTGDLDNSNAGGNDIFVRKFDADGTTLWTRQLGSSGSESKTDVATDALGNVIVVSSTPGDLGGPTAGGRDVFVVEYAADGDFSWLQQIGSNVNDTGWAITPDPQGHIYIAGSTDGDLGGPSLGGSDGFLAKFREGIAGDYDKDGDVDGGDFLLWQRGQSPLGAVVEDLAEWKANFGMKLTAVAASTVVPEPKTLLLVILAGSVEIVRRRRTL